MKKSLKAVLLIIGILILVGVVIGVIKMNEAGKFDSELALMKPLETKEVKCGVYAINNKFVNFYLIKSGEKYIAIDSGADIEKTKSELGNLGIDPKSVIAIFLTHSDYDHVSGIKLFNNASVYISKEEEQMISGKTKRSQDSYNKLEASYNLLNDGQEIDIGDFKIKGILTPGHTPGSMSYIINNQMIFTGDTMSLKDGKAELFNQSFNMNSQEETNSIAKLSRLDDIQYIFTSHYGFTDNFKNVFKNEEK